MCILLFINSEENQKLNDAIKEQAISMIAVNMLNQNVYLEIQKICKEVIYEEKEQRKRRLNFIKGKVLIKRSGRYFKR